MKSVLTSEKPAAADTTSLRLMSYNVHRCLGLDRRYAPQRVAEVIASCHPDVVALQEVDVGRPRSGRVHQAEVIARELGMDFHFFPRLRILEQQYGDAVLSRLSTRLVKAAQLPAWRGREPRGALWVAISTGGSELQVINTHLGLWSRERLVQIEALLGREWLSHPGCREPFVLTGDFNAPDRSRAYRRIVSRLTDAYRAANCRPKPTYPTRYPVLRLDHVFVSRGVEVVDMRTLRTPLARFASDHFPVIADLNLPVLHVHGSQFAMLGDDPAC